MPPRRLIDALRRRAREPGGALFLLLVAAAAAVGVFGAIGMLSIYSGDAAIYWAYAKSFWAHGPFHYGPDGPKHAATSPLWAFVLIALHPIFTSTFIAYKAAAMLALAGAGASTYRLCREISGDVRASIAAGLLVFASPALQNTAGAGYETPFFALVVLEAVRLTLRLSREATTRRLVAWAAVLACLPLARPEGALFLVPCLVWGAVVLVRRGTSPGRLAGAFALTVAPSLVYYGGMYLATDLLVPAPIQARYLRRAVDDAAIGVAAWRALSDQCTGAMYLGGWYFTYFHHTWNACVVVAAALFAYRGTRGALLVAAPPLLLLAAFSHTNPGDLLYRYGAPVQPMGTIFASVGAAWLLQRPLRWIRGAPAALRHLMAGVLAAGVVAFFILPVQLIEEKATMVRLPAGAVLDTAGTDYLNENLDPDAVVLVYEIQIQYDLECQALSADGVVGGEILPYLRNGSVLHFLTDYGVTHILMSRAFDERDVFDATLLRRLAEIPDEVTAVEAGGLRFTRVARREVPESEDPNLVSYLSLMPHWTEVIAVEPRAIER